MNKTNVPHLPEESYKGDIARFGDWMLQQLRDNEHKGHWPSWKPKLSEMEMMVARTWHQLKIAHASNNPRRAAELSADLANLALKCFSEYGEQ